MITLTARAHQPFSSYEGPRWHSIEFDAVEIERAWPKPPPLSLKDWMLTDANRLLQTTRQLGKRIDMVHRCMKETTCTKRQAEAAHKALPEGLRRKVGNKGKNQQGN